MCSCILNLYQYLNELNKGLYAYNIMKNAQNLLTLLSLVWKWPGHFKTAILKGPEL